MPRDTSPSPFDRHLPLTNPWPLLGPALATAGLVWFLHAQLPQQVGARVALIVASMVMALGGVGLRLRAAREDADNRFKTAGIVALACFVPLLCRLSLDADWDSVGLLLDVVIGVGLAASGLLLLPRVVRRVALTVLVLVHFGGILSAVGSPPPPSGQRSWLDNQLWVAFYRPYLNFMYLNNAYHFYSPDPGPPILVWFRIEYEGGKSRWVEVPSFGTDRSKLSFQRRLALGESTNQLVVGSPWDFEERWARRIEAGLNYEGRGAIPPLNDPQAGRYFEYREPSAYSKRILESYARYVLSHYPYVDDQGAEHPEVKPRTVKIYRVLHAIANTQNIASGFNPYNPVTYFPYYQGKFDPAGRLLDGPTFQDCKVVKPGDPFLYWLIPIKVEPVQGYKQRQDAHGRPLLPEPKDLKLVDYLKVHAGDNESILDRRPK